ncbi:MAG TPA: acetyl/propionyl/methylcrotonyl-CoA carboxylase subunit alpha [Casimicrobiaceae bacterium]|nr:acetyl/propionyl/methylcrotonyl-CoA carboxylase subunit alpha [Casimicrobiaceae bacterium]
MFDKILIANRGEIACRVARTARKMGIRTVAVYSDVDVRALHVSMCDEAYRLGPAAPRESYLNGEAIIATAKAARAEAIHPGYGFLSENEAFAAAVAAAGMVFIGPPPAAIRAMGSKSESKRIMGKAGVPLVPGYHGDDQGDAVLGREALAIGYPVLIKASAGGGGKGMRVVERREDFDSALASARREAKSSFGDGAMLIEKYLTAPRHIEMQVFADAHGDCIHLFERDCSVQRRHQKIVEEAPAPGMTAKRRSDMGAAAVASARAIGYVGAGTVEFIVEDALDPRSPFYFMEMNTRLQVEHPVTEMITGLDLVEWQLRVAAGEPLPLAQNEIEMNGHAIEARIYAEDPERGFLPSIGRIAHLRAPEASGDVRIDTGVRAGDEITRYYDPMIAKLIAHGADRDAARRRLAAALSDYEIVGVATNVAFLQRLIAHESFAEAHIDTGLIARHHAALFPAATPPSDSILAVAALAELARLHDAAEVRARSSTDRYSPWHAIDTWWLNTRDHTIDLAFESDGAVHPVSVATTGATLTVSIDGRARRASIDDDGANLIVRYDGASFRATVVSLGGERHVFCGGEARRLRLLDPLAHVGEAETHAGHLAAPMSGTVVSVLVKPGDAVAKGAPLLILEAMKMEHTIAAPADGIVSAVNYRTGDQVQEGADLVDLDEGTRA